MPVASAAASCHVPDSDFTPPEAAAIQSDGRVRVANVVPAASAAAHVAGSVPVQIFIVGDVLIAVSMASRAALRAVVEN